MNFVNCRNFISYLEYLLFLEYSISYLVTLWLFNIAIENGPFIDDFPIKTSMYKGFSSSLC